MQSKLVVVLLFFAASLNIFVSSCTDITVNDGEPWYDSLGDTCEWYGESNYCRYYGSLFENFEMVANEACCVCGGGFRNPTTSPSPTLSTQPSPGPTLSTQPSSSPTSCTDKTANDSWDDGRWYDSYGYSCSSYEFYDRCTSQGHMYEMYGMTANEACCVCGGGQMIFPTLSPQPSASPYPTSTPSSWNNKVMDPTARVIIVIGAVLAFLFIVGVCLKYAKNSSRNSHNNAAQSTNLRTRPAQRTPQQTQHAGSSIVDERDIRRQFILTNIIHKKVVTKSHQSSDDSGESVITGTIADYSQSVEIVEGQIIFTHEAIVRERSERIASMRLSLNHDLGSDEEQGHGINDKKDDICIETLRSIRTEMNIHLDMDSLDESMYSPKSCPICCEDYVKGDDVAWSKNEGCYHVFHTDCIVPWLMDHDDCPMCRCVYVKEGERDVASC